MAIFAVSPVRWYGCTIQGQIVENRGLYGVFWKALPTRLDAALEWIACMVLLQSCWKVLLYGIGAWWTAVRPYLYARMRGQGLVGYKAGASAGWRSYGSRYCLVGVSNARK